MTRKAFISVFATGLLTATSTLAGQWDGNPDMSGSILNDLDKPSYVGTSLGMTRPSYDAYQGGFSGNPDIGPTRFIIGRGSPEKGTGDLYGWVIYDVAR